MYLGLFSSGLGRHIGTEVTVMEEEVLIFTDPQKHGPGTRCLATRGTLRAGQRHRPWKVMWVTSIPLRALVPFLGGKYLEMEIWENKLGILFLYLFCFVTLTKISRTVAGNR